MTTHLRCDIGGCERIDVGLRWIGPYAGAGARRIANIGLKRAKVDFSKGCNRVRAVDIPRPVSIECGLFDGNGREPLPEHLTFPNGG